MSGNAAKRTRILLDTSVIIPSLIREHPHHAAASAVFERALRGEADLLVAAHALAEAYATLTVLQPRLTPASVQRLLAEGLLPYVEVVALDGDEYVAVLGRMVARGLVSGAIYDALHVRAAEKAGAHEIVTFNGRDFHRMPPEPPCRVVVL